MPSGYLHPLEHQVEQHLRQVCRLAPGRNVLVACSGGPDSVVLAAMLKQLGQPFGLVHAQFHLRAQDSLDDEQLVRQLAMHYGVPFYVQVLDVKDVMEREHVSLQMAARELRYAFFESVRKAEGYHRIATAHHADDQAETVLMRLLQGSGLHGLRGIPVERDKIIRPLLFARKKDLMEYASARGLNWRLDRSNEGSDYRRNAIRHSVLPVLEKLQPGATEALIRSAEQLSGAEKIYHKGLQRLRQRILHHKNKELHIGIASLQESGSVAVLLAEWLLPLGFSAAQLSLIADSLNGQSGAHWTSPKGTLFRERKTLVWVPGSTQDADHPAPLVVEELPLTLNFSDWRFRLERVDKASLPEIPPADGVLLDAEKVSLPLILRCWRDGDYFYPSPGGKKRKIKRYLTDRKVASRKKKDWPVLLSGEYIVWVPGLTADKRFAAGPKTRHYLKIKIEQSGLD